MNIAKLFSDDMKRKSENLIQLAAQADLIVQVSDCMVSCFKSGNKVMFCGNGGSAADAQHLAAEFMGRYLKERAPLPSIALNANTSSITAIGNDYGYEKIFERQVRGIGSEGDVLVGISTSGNSLNIVEAFQVAQKIGIKTVALTGNDGGKLSQLADINIIVPASDTPSIQEMHITVGHAICGFVEDALT
jgi:D-sedoheptulose 7-phosphate isomerase